MRPQTIRTLILSNLRNVFQHFSSIALNNAASKPVCAIGPIEPQPFSDVTAISDAGSSQADSTNETLFLKHMKSSSACFCCTPLAWVVTLRAALRTACSTRTDICMASSQKNTSYGALHSAGSSPQTIANMAMPSDSAFFYGTQAMSTVLNAPRSRYCQSVLSCSQLASGTRPNSLSHSKCFAKAACSACKAATVALLAERSTTNCCPRSHYRSNTCDSAVGSIFSRVAAISFNAQLFLFVQTLCSSESYLSASNASNRPSVTTSFFNTSAREASSCITRFPAHKRARTGSLCLLCLRTLYLYVKLACIVFHLFKTGNRLTFEIQLIASHRKINFLHSQIPCTLLLNCNIFFSKADMRPLNGSISTSLLQPDRSCALLCCMSHIYRSKAFPRMLLSCLGCLSS